MSNEQNIRGVSRDRTKPSPGQQGEYVPVRTSRYGEVMNRNVDRRTLAEEGSYFVATNAINDAATTLAGHAAPVLADADDTMTKPFVFIRVPANATKLVYLDFIEIEVTAVNTGGTSDNWADQLDTGTTRRSSGGSELRMNNPNMNSSETSIFSGTTLAMMGGAVVAAAESSSVRHLGHGQIRAAIHVVGDRYLFQYGGDPSVGANVVATAASRHVISRPPVILGATDQYLLALYAPSQTVAAVYKLRLGWFERERT
jgi:hypothetical protein